MNRESLEKEINEVMVEGFELDPNQLNAGAKIVDDLELDSLDAIDMLVFLEDKIKIKVDAETFRSVRTLGDVYDVVENIMKESND